MTYTLERWSRLLELTLVVVLVYGAIMTGMYVGEQRLINRLDSEIADLQDTVVQLTASLDYQEKTDASKTFIIAYIQKRNRSIGARTAELLADTFISTGEEFDLDPLFLAAQAGVESAFKIWAKSDANAVGVMQVVPSIWVSQIPWLETEDDLYNIHSNIRAGGFVMAHYRGVCGGTLREALTCYHGGPRALKLPRSSTTAYVSRVLARWKTLELM